MSLYDFFRTLFGIPNHRNDTANHGVYNEEPRDQNEYGYNAWEPSNETQENLWRDSHEDNPSEENFGFNIFTDPLEMHRYFEQQMNEVLKSFSGFFGQDSGTFFGDMPASILPPQGFEDYQQLEPSKKNLRDQLLKPGYENASESRNNLPSAREDGDLDGRISAGDLDALLPDKQRVPSNENKIIPQIRTFGQSMSSKTIRRPDGTMETHRTVRDSAGNVETIITKQVGDKQYTVTTRTNKDGKQEKHEEMVNIDDNELSHFTNNWSRNPSSPNDPNKWFPYDKFFK